MGFNRIGLAFVGEVARNHGGYLDIANRPAGGAVVTFAFACINEKGLMMSFTLCGLDDDESILCTLEAMASTQGCSWERPV